jgi:hypothetical protein
MRQPRTRRLVLAIAAIPVLVLAATAIGAWAVLATGALPTSVPSCSWPLRVHGRVPADEVGLIRCYVRALAQADLPALRGLVEPDPAHRITVAQLAHAGDARAGLATATFTPNPSDSAYFTVGIKFADGASESFPMLLANPESSHSWRIDVGPLVDPGPDIPPAAP